MTLNEEAGCALRSTSTQSSEPCEVPQWHCGFGCGTQHQNKHKRGTQHQNKHKRVVMRISVIRIWFPIRSISIIKIRLHFYHQNTIAFLLSHYDCVSIVMTRISIIRIRLHFYHQNTIAFPLSHYDCVCIVMTRISIIRIRFPIPCTACFCCASSCVTHKKRVLSPFYSQDVVPDSLYTRFYCASSCVTHTHESCHLCIRRITSHTYGLALASRIDKIIGLFWKRAL